MMSNAFPGAEQSDPSPSRFSGLVVFIRILGGFFALLILLGLLLPALNSPHRASRRLKCQSNLKQMALSAQAYAEFNQHYPLASSQPFTGQPGTYQSPNSAGYSWTVGLLPYFDLRSLDKEFKAASNDYQLDVFDPSNSQEIPTLVIPLLLCPDPQVYHVDVEHSEYRKLQSGQELIAPARSSYVAFAASHFSNNSGSGQLYESNRDSPWDGNGVFPFPKSAADVHKGIGLNDITDGTTYTVMFCESRETAYAAWCDGQAMWAVGAWPASPKMPKPSGAPDGRLGWPDSDKQSRASIQSGSESEQAEFYLPASRYHAKHDRRWGPSSLHANGEVVHAFADGSVRMIAPDIDRNLYLRLISRDGSEVFDWADIE